MSISNPGFQGLPRRRQLHDSPAGAAGREVVDCLPTQPRVEGTPLPPPLRTIPAGQEGEGQKLLPVTNTHSPRRPRPAQRHQPPARTRAADDHPQRTRRRAGRARERSAGGHPGAPTPRCRNWTGCSRSSPARIACWPKLAVDSDRELAPLAQVREQTPTTSRRATRSRRRAPATCSRSNATSSCSRRSCASSDRRANARRASPNKSHRRSGTSGSQPRDQRGVHQTAGVLGSSPPSSRASARPPRCPAPRSWRPSRCSRS